MKLSAGLRHPNPRWIAVVAAGLAVVTGGIWYGVASRHGANDARPAVGAAESGAASTGSAEVPGANASDTGAPSGARGTWWRPGTGLTWQWQLSGTLDPTVAVNVYDIDGAGTSTADVAALHRAGRKVICYVNVGAVEDFRADKDRFPAAVLGRAVEGWAGERWLDIRDWDALRPVLASRFDTCRQKKFDGVEADNVDGYRNETGFPLTAADQLTFNRRVADLAHGYGLAAGLKNDPEQAGDLVSSFDFAISEECAQYRECEAFTPFVKAGKAVFQAEYELPTSAFCQTARKLGFSAIRKKVALDAWREGC